MRIGSRVLAFIIVCLPLTVNGESRVAAPNKRLPATKVPVNAVVVNATLLAGPAPAAAAKWTTFADPTLEHSFSVDIPQGWKVNGGSSRASALQVWQWLRAVSPDDAITLILSDPRLLSFYTPAPLLLQMGLREGSPYNVTSVHYTIRHYQPGDQFAIAYGQDVFPQICSGLSLKSRESRPELTAPYNAQTAAVGFHYDAGEAVFSCQKSGQASTGYVFATTLFANVLNSGHGFSYPTYLVGFLAPDAQAPQAAALIAHMVETFRIDPAWQAGQQNTNMQVSRIAANANAAVSSTIMQSWQARRESQGRIMDEDSRARLGIDYYADPTTGERYQVENKSNFYWVDHAGRVMGTQTDTPPRLDFRRMTRIPAGQ
jgi:hypothetical protein